MILRRNSRTPTRLLLGGLLAWQLLKRFFVKRVKVANPQRILIAHHLLLGDTLLLTPLLAKLRQLYPYAEIVMTLPPSYMPLYLASPYGVVARSYQPKNWRTLWALYDSKGYDLAIIPGDNRYSWLAYALGSRWIVAFAGDVPAYKNWPCDELKPYPLKSAAWGDIVAGLVPGEVPPPYQSIQWPVTLVKDGPSIKEPYAILHLGSSTPLKQWLPSRWMALALWLQQKNIKVIWSAGKGEEKLVESVDPQGLFTSYAGQCDLLQLWHLIKNAELLVCPDTAVAHMGRLCETPTIALFGPGNPEIHGGGEFWKNSPFKVVWVEKIPCRNQDILFRRHLPWVKRCGRSTGECQNPICMQAIDCEEVMKAIEEFKL